MEVFLKQLFFKISQNYQKNTCTGVPFLSSTSNFINEEILAQCFPKLHTVFSKSYIVDVWLCYKYSSVLHLELNPSYKEFLLWKSVITIATVLKNFANFTGKHVYRNPILVKLKAWLAATLLKRDSNTSEKFENIFKNIFFLQNTSGGCFCVNQLDPCLLN